MGLRRWSESSRSFEPHSKAVLRRPADDFPLCCDSTCFEQCTSCRWASRLSYRRCDVCGPPKQAGAPLGATAATQPKRLLYLRRDRYRLFQRVETGKPQSQDSDEAHSQMSRSAREEEHLSHVIFLRWRPLRLAPTERPKRPTMSARCQSFMVSGVGRSLPP